MSSEYTSDSPEYSVEPELESTPAYAEIKRYSSFCPLLILLVGLMAWSGYQLFVVNQQRVAFDQQLAALGSRINGAQTARARLISLAQDLVQTSAHNTYAAQIVKENDIKLTNPSGTSAAPSSQGK